MRAHAGRGSATGLEVQKQSVCEAQIIPALERALSLVGADVRAWFAVLPRPQRLLPQKRPAASVGLGGERGGHAGGPGAATAATIDSYYLSRHCAVRPRPFCAHARCPGQWLCHDHSKYLRVLLNLIAPALESAGGLSRLSNLTTPKTMSGRAARRLL